MPLATVCSISTLGADAGSGQPEYFAEQIVQIRPAQSRLLMSRLCPVCDVDDGSGALADIRRSAVERGSVQYAFKGHIGLHERAIGFAVLLGHVVDVDRSSGIVIASVGERSRRPSVSDGFIVLVVDVGTVQGTLLRRGRFIIGGSSRDFVRDPSCKSRRYRAHHSGIDGDDGCAGPEYCFANAKE